ncbi:RNA-directed DNA polymerase, eukaryota [Tanacetum coccineum]
MNILRCFFLLSGISINIQKSHLLGVGIPDNCVAEAAKSIGCLIMKAPFKYLGILVGDNMSSKKAWDETINKMKKRLSRWKLNTLSVGGRLTLLKSVLGSTPIYNMSIFKVPKSVLNYMESLRRNFFNGFQEGDRKIAWVKWSKVLASKKFGGLGVSSFFALNRALLFKWVWRYLSHDNSLWSRIISALHGLNGHVLSAAFNSTWSSIITEVNSLKVKGVDLISHCKIRVGKGTGTSFWKDLWIGDNLLKLSFPRLFALEENKDISVADKMNTSISSSFRRHVRGGVESQQLDQLSLLLDTVILSNMDDRWFWDLNGDGVFQVKDVRSMLDEAFLPKMEVPTRWIKSIPIKVNVFAWKLYLDRLPTRSNLSRRNVSLPSLACPLCDHVLEDSSHLFFGCSVAKDIQKLICRWWNLDVHPYESYEDWLSWFKSIRLDNIPGNASQPKPNPTTSGNKEKASSVNDKFQASGSILEVMDELIKVGQTMGYNMDGCMKNIEAIIGGILCVWDPRLFVKDNSTVSDSFLAISGACGALFNFSWRNSFNNFITRTGLIDLPLEGYSFTWAHKSASKMSKLDRFLIFEGLLALFPSISALCLDKYLSDHRPILLRELNVDYGPTPFRFFHSWSSRKGFDKMVEDSGRNSVCWESNRDKKSGLGLWNKQISCPDGFTFEFYRKYWSLIDHDVVAAVTSFFSIGSFPPGCISSFITLIPKSQEPKMVKDFRPISLIGSMYKIITKVLANRLSLVISELVSDVQSAFVSNRHILDGPFILNELLSWCKHKKSKALIFKIDFEKAFDSVRWDYLDVVLANFGFGLKWRSWIQGCLNSAMGSILVNGSPTSEFKFSKGLKQGDPLSPFLFILIMESLHLSFNNVVNVGLYNGIQIDESLNLSYLFYADDVIFVGKWNSSNLSTIVNVLKWFYLASGLKINLNKSKLMGIGISHDVVASAAKSIGCSIIHTPFNYLGVKIDGIMSRLSSWDEVIAKLSARLSKWKLKSLSIGGRLTLIKSVLSSLPLYYMSSFKVPKGVLNKIESIRRNFFNGVENAEKKMSLIGWNKILASKKNGGLGVSSFFTYNCALLFKWIWQFLANGASLWSRFISAIYGIRGALDNSSSYSRRSPLLDIVNEVRKLAYKGIDLLSLVKKKVGIW